MANTMESSSAGSEKKCRICIVNEFFYPDNAGGTGSVLSDLTRTLRQNHPELQIDVIASCNLYRDKDVVLPALEDWDGVAIHRVRVPHAGGSSTLMRLLLNSLFGCLSLGMLLRISSPPFDMLLIGTAPPTLAMAASLYKLLTGTPYTYIIYDLDPDRAIRMGVITERSLFAKLLRALQLGWLSRASKIVVLGRCMRDYISETYRIPRSKFEVIPIGADPAEIVPLIRATRLRERCRLSGFVVSYSGNFGRYHNFDTMLDAAKRLLAMGRDVTFLLIGDGAKKAYVEARIADERIENVKVMPFVPKDEYADSLATADASLVTLEPGMEGLCVPSKFYSILASGRPVLAMVGENSEVAHVLNEAHCGYRIDQADVEALVECIIRLADNPAESERMGRNARRVLVENYATELVAEKYYNLIVHDMQGTGCPDRGHAPGLLSSVHGKE